MNGSSAEQAVDSSASKPSAAAPTAESPPGLNAVEEALEYHFQDRGLLVAALQHSSYSHERQLQKEQGASVSPQELESNERLEFLGDSVLGLVVAQALYTAKPDWNEGDLTRALHSIVEGKSLTRLARRLGLGAALRLGRTEEASGGREKDSILENAMEAVIGALYLDGGIDGVAPFVDRAFGELLASDALRVERDSKTELQERLMASEGAFPKYRLVGDSEVEGDNLRFTVEVVLAGAVLGSGVGRTKRAAEKRAASAALAKQESEEGQEDG